MILFIEIRKRRKLYNIIVQYYLTLPVTDIFEIININSFKIYLQREDKLFISNNIILFISGVRQVQDIYVRLIDSATKQVSTNIFVVIYIIYLYIIKN